MTLNREAIASYCGGVNPKLITPAMVKLFSSMLAYSEAVKANDDYDPNGSVYSTLCSLYDVVVQERHQQAIEQQAANAQTHYELKRMMEPKRPPLARHRDTKGREWTLKEAYWQLPCGHRHANFWTSDDAGEAYCAHCNRGWKHMTDICRMLDGKPQGPLVDLKQQRAIADANQPKTVFQVEYADAL